MIHELIDPKKKTNKTTASRNTRTFLDNKPCSDQLNFDPSDSENKEVDSSATFIPPWLRNSLGLSQRHNQSHLAVGHSEQKPAKIIHRFKEPAQDEFDGLKANEECCKNVHGHYGSLPEHCREEGNTMQEQTKSDVITSSDRVHWQLVSKESETESSSPDPETRCFEKIDPKITNSDLMTFAEIGKLREDDKKKLKFIRQKSKGRRRNVTEPKTFEQSRTDTDYLGDAKEKEEMNSCAKKNIHTVPSEIRDLEAKFLLLGKYQDSNSPRLNQMELRLLQDMKKQVGSIGDFDLLLEQKKNLNSGAADPEFFVNGVGDKKADDVAMQKFTSDLKPDADKDSMLSTDDENDIKRFSEFLSKNKNADEKRKCLEEVRNYFEKKRKSRLSKKRYLEGLKTKLSPESERKEVHKDRIKCRELTMILPNRGKRSKFALCDEEVVERAVDETLQKFVELYHFHVSPRVMGNMKKNILQAMQSDSMESCVSKAHPDEEKLVGKKIRGGGLAASKPPSPKKEVQAVQPKRPDIPEIVDDESPSHKEKKKTFKTQIVNSNEHVGNQPKETDAVDNERLKRLNKEFEIFLRSIQTHVDVSNLKIQSIILEKEEANPAKHVQFVYNFTKKAIETEKQVPGQPNREGQEIKSSKEVGVQVSFKKEAAKKSVRIQAMECQETLEQCLQTEEKMCSEQLTQTEGNPVIFRELRELKSFDINPGLYRMVKSKEAGKFYLYPEQPDCCKEQSYSKSDSSVLKDRKTRKKELINVLGKERNKERRILLREKDRGKLKKAKKVSYTSSYLKTLPVRREKELKKRDTETKCEDVAKTESSVNCLYFRNLEGKNSEAQPCEKQLSPKGENVPETSDKLGVGDAKEEHLGCVWLWNGEKISPGCDLKMHVENLLKEKLKEITEMECVQKNLLMTDLHMQKSETLSSPKNIYLKDLSLSRTDTEVLQGPTESHKHFEMNKSNPVFCYTSYSNVNTEKNSRMQFPGGSDYPEPVEKPDSKKLEENNEIKSSRLSILQDKLVRNVGTQNSQQKFLSINLARTRTQSKTTIAVTKKKESRRLSSVKPLPRRLINFKKAEEIIRAVEKIKKLEMELRNARSVEPRDSDSLLDASSSSFSSKNEVEKPLSLVLGLRDRPSRTEGTSSCTVKSRLRKVMDLVNHEVQTGTQEVQTKSPDELEDANSEERVNAEQQSGKHLELIENFLCKVSQRERENLWNDVREFIKTKIGRDINDDGAKEVCIEIEQDMPKHEQGAVRQAVLARGHYVKNEGDVEVEIDLTLDDLEKILRQRQKRIRKQSLQRKKYKRILSSSSVQSDLNKDEMHKYQKYLDRVAALGEGLMAESPSRSLKKNKGN